MRWISVVIAMLCVVASVFIATAVNVVVNSPPATPTSASLANADVAASGSSFACGSGTSVSFDRARLSLSNPEFPTIDATMTVDSELQRPHVRKLSGTFRLDQYVLVDVCLVKDPGFSSVVGIVASSGDTAGSLTALQLVEIPAHGDALHFGQLPLKDSDLVKFKELDHAFTIVTQNEGLVDLWTSTDSEAFPLLIARLKGETLENVTTQYPSLIRADAALWWHYAFHAGAQQKDAVFAAWIGDECMIGNGRASWQWLNHFAATGRLARRLSGETAQSYLTSLRGDVIHARLCDAHQLPLG